MSSSFSYILLLDLVLVLVLISIVYADTSVSSTSKNDAFNQAVQREILANEDPLQKKDVELKKYEQSINIQLYGSIRIRYRNINNGKSVWEDNGSRIGVNADYQFQENSWFFGRYEMGFNLLKEIGIDDIDYQPDQEFSRTFLTRLAYYRY